MLDGDIVLGTAEALEQMRATGMPAANFDGVAGPCLKAWCSREDHRWPDGVIPYEINERFNETTQTRIAGAISHWEAYTTIRFSPSTSRYEDHVVFVPGDKCSSYVGRIGGRQAITLKNDVCTMGNAIHEIGHAVGLMHQQSRCDRDDYVEILPENVNSSERLRNFDKRCVSPFSLAVPYDFESVMHYSPTNSFSKKDADGNLLPTIRSLNGEVFGQRVGLSGGDIATVELMYWKAADTSPVHVGLSDGARFDAGPRGSMNANRHTRFLTGNFDGDSNGVTDLLSIEVAPQLEPTEQNLNMSVWTGSRRIPHAWGTWKTNMFTKYLTGDFDNNGTTDVVKFDVPRVGTQETDIWVALSNGRSFSISRWATWPMSRHTRIAVGDFNGDGKSDIVGLAVNPDPLDADGKRQPLVQRRAQRVGLSTGAGFNIAVWGYVNASREMAFLAGEFNGYTGDDVLTVAIPRLGARTGNLVVGGSRGPLTPPSFPALPTRPIATRALNLHSFQNSTWAAMSAATWMRFLAGDFDGDGLIDITRLAVPRFGTISGILETGLSAGTEFSVAGSGALNMQRDMVAITGNFDGDGGNRAEILKILRPESGRADVGVWVGRFDGQRFSLSGSWATWNMSRRTEVLTGDFNGDGITDIMTVDVD